MDVSELASRPISEASPGGADAKYEPEYEALTAEIAKLSSIQGDPVSWPHVVDWASQILERKSKDLTVGAYMALGLQETQGVMGLLQGAELLRGLFSAFWDSAFPPPDKKRRRANSYQWWHQRAFDLLERQKDQALASADREALVQTLKELDSLAGSLMDDVTPLRDLIDLARSLSVTDPEEPQVQQEEAQERQTAEAPLEKAPSDPGPNAQAPQAAPGADQRPKDLPSLRSDFTAAARDYGLALRSQNPADPLAWQLPRLAIWNGIAALPAHDGDGQTQIQPPDGDRLSAVEQLLSSRNWLPAALAADDLFPSYPLCLDLQRIAGEALKQLGPAFSEASEALRSETRRFLSRLPELPSLRYDGGQPLASEATQLWLAGLSQGTVGAVALAAVPPSQEDSLTAAAVAEALELLDSQGPVEALRRLESALGSSATANARLRCQELRILCGQGASKAAAALARALRRDLERDRLMELEPDLAAEVLAAIHDGLLLGQDLEGAEAVREVLAGLRPSVALIWG